MSRGSGPRYGGAGHCTAPHGVVRRRAADACARRDSNPQPPVPRTGPSSSCGTSACLCTGTAVVRALGEIRTHTGGVLNAVPLPLGYEGVMRAGNDEMRTPPGPGSVSRWAARVRRADGQAVASSGSPNRHRHRRPHSRSNPRSMTLASRCFRPGRAPPSAIAQPQSPRSARGRQRNYRPAVICRNR